jgi:hypothetical protein
MLMWKFQSDSAYPLRSDSRGPREGFGAFVTRFSFSSNAVSSSSHSRSGARSRNLAASGYLEGAADAATVETLRGFYLRRENEPSTLRSFPLDAAA